MSDTLTRDVVRLFELQNVTLREVRIKNYPDERNILVYVEDGQYSKALEIAESIERQLSNNTSTLIVVRRAQQAERPSTVTVDVRDSAALDFQRIVAARNRVSEVQPSLSYVKDYAENLATIAAQRHHLVFGRRGVGKSTLLVEAKRVVENEGSLTTWINLQTLRRETPIRIFLRIAREIVGNLLAELSNVRADSAVTAEASRLYDTLATLISNDATEENSGTRVIPEIQRVLRRGLALIDKDMYVFVDDFYYVSRDEQPEMLDILHGCVRDCRAWLKIASIKNLTKWWTPSPPRGLQTGQDADLISLDITLQDPGRLRKHLTTILEQYCLEVGISRPTRLFRPDSLDRLLFASGGVPRDFLVLASAAVGKARERESAKVVGVQDVNRAAGDAADAKIQELEEDLASNIGLSGRTLEALGIIRRFCLDEVASTFYGVDFFDKETNAREYQVFSDLLDLRLLHVIHESVSDAHEAGRKHEVFMLDLSQYTGSRLKQGLRVLDLQGDSLLVKRTRVKDSARNVSDSKSLISVLRTSPGFPLSRFSQLVSRDGTAT
ncbi:hypothetical protein Franean1_6317 [Parafrankia sp. EAN1pec]|uniref:AAA family ATPase n=1 Tax=Parafrankia sp. (strain EAN1pec) TaxID=298653 RepID=UPI0000540712|nr:hypothetical protein Franean1_6317 [Frankia sp. EAN1pec]